MCKQNCVPLVLALVLHVTAVGAQDAPQPRGWVIQTAPVAVIDGDRLAGPVGGVIREDGSIVIADALAAQILFFDSLGVLLHVAGGEGRGPGEFVDISYLSIQPADYVHVYDGRQRRLSYFSRTGEFSGAAALTAVPKPIRVAGRFADGSYFAISDQGLRPARPGSLISGVSEVFVVSENLDSVYSATTLPGFLTASFSADGRVGFRVAPFSPTVEYAQAENCLFALSTGDGGLSMISGDGQLLQLPGVAGESVQVTAADRDAWIEATLETVPATEREAMRKVLRGIPVPSEHPLFRKILSDPEGLLWVQRTRAGDAVTDIWEIISPQGLHLASLPIPLGNLVAVGRDRLLLETVDPLGVTSYQVHPLRRPPVSSPLPDRCAR